MHVVAVLPAYPPNSRVGAFLATHELLAELVRRGHRVDVRAQTYGETFDLDGVTVGPRDAIDAAVAVCDLVVSHAGDDGLAAAVAAKHSKRSVRVVHGHHDDLSARLFGADLVVFNSTATAFEAGYEGRQVVVRPTLRDVRATPGDRVTLVNLSEPKGGELFWRLARGLPEVQFLGVRGYGRQMPGRAANVEVFEPTADMRAVFGTTRLLLMPSERETWGMTGVEAMSCGIPVIAHPTPGLVESLGDAGIFVDRDDAQGWVEQIERLSDPAGWGAASRKALEHVAPDDRAVFVEAVESLLVAA